jgi:hypothetical protein
MISMMKRILYVLIVSAVLMAALALPAGAATGMSVMGGFYGTSMDTGKATAFSDAKSLISGTKSGALSSYTFTLKPDLNAFRKDTTLYTDPAQLEAWNKEAMKIPESKSGYFSLFMPRGWGSSGCCSCG